MPAARADGTCGRRLGAWAAAALLAAAVPAASQGAPPGEHAPALRREEPPPLVFSPDRAVSLQEAVQIGFQYHGRLIAAEENVEGARQRVRQVRTGILPQVMGQVGYTGRGVTDLGGLFGSGRAPDQVQFDMGLQPRIGLGYNVWDGGLTRAAVRQARAGLDGTAASLDAARNNLAFLVTTSYLVQLRAQRLLELRRVQEELAAEQLRRVDARIEQEVAPVAERALPLAEFRNRQVERIRAENAVRVAANSLRNAMGLPVGQPLLLVELADESQPALLPLETLREIARRERPEVLQLEAFTRVAEAGANIARIRRKPRLDTGLTFDLLPNNPFSRGLWSIGAAVTMPLWDAGLTHAREQEAMTDVHSALAQLEQARRDVAAEVEEAYLNLLNARERFDASQLAVQAAQDNLEAATTRFELGAPGVTVLDLIAAQGQFATAATNVIQAQYDVYLAQAQLDRAIGRL